jgi:DNA modification methylase
MPKRRPEPEMAAEGTVERCRPSAAEPVLRRYRPAGSLDLAREGVVDWRQAGPAPLESLDEVADRVICGDAARVLRKLPAASVACVITSPPYWNQVDYGVDGQVGLGGYEQYLADLLEVWAQCERVLEPNGKLCINTPIVPVPKAVMRAPHTRHLKNLSADIEASILGELTLERFSLYVWQKQTTEKMFGSYPYPPNLFEQNTVEFINVLVKPGKPKRLPAAVKERARLTEAQWLNLTRQVWPLYPAEVKRARHPAPFPEALPNRLVAMYTFPQGPPESGFTGDVVLDPFCGTGATCVAARKLGRRTLGVDLGPDFAALAARRLRAAEADGEVFMCPDGPTPRRNGTAGSPPDPSDGPL